MFEKLFSENGLSLDRLRVLLEVGATGSIVKAADGDPVRQSQYSRQIRELEDFFRAKLIERVGKGTRLTSTGRELARISRFFMLGLSNFQRGCLEEGHNFRIGASSTFIQEFLLPALLAADSPNARSTYVTEVIAEEQIERRLHDLTLDFGIVKTSTLSRPLETRILAKWKLELWVPKALGLSSSAALRAHTKQQLPMAFARTELEKLGIPNCEKLEQQLICDSFLEAEVALAQQHLAALLPDFLVVDDPDKLFMRVRVPNLHSKSFAFYLAWNPRLLRLNPHAIRQRDRLIVALTRISAVRHKA